VYVKLVPPGAAYLPPIEGVIHVRERMNGLRLLTTARSAGRDEVERTRLDAGDDLHGGRADADDRDALVLEVDVLGPARAVQHLLRQVRSRREGDRRTPLNDSRPGMSGHFQSLSTPVPLMKTCAESTNCVPSVVRSTVTSHIEVAAFHSALTILWLRRA